MKAPGGNYSAPNTPAPPANLIQPQGQTAVNAPPQQSFLPSDPNAMATGLTPEMLAAIEAAPPPQLQQAQAAAAPPGAAKSGFHPSVQAQVLMAMGVDPKLILGDRYNEWASQPVTRGDLAMQMTSSRLKGKRTGGSGRGDLGGASTTGGRGGFGGSSARSGGLY